MYEASSIFVQPENDDIQVWRYMDFTKFVSFIDSQSLYFARADKFDDPFEGSLPKMNVVARESVQLRILSSPHFPPEAREMYLKQVASTGEINQYWRKFYAINCWHMNEHESAAMWRLYLKSNEGIAVQSTYRKLRESIIDDEKVYLGQVKYIDYEKESIGHYYDPDSANDFVFNMFAPFVYKRKSFEHEREIRALIERPPTTSEEQIGRYQDTIAHGVEIKVDIKQLVENIYVAPSAPDWLSSLVSKVAQRYGFTFQVVRSRLSEQPLF